MHCKSLTRHSIAPYIYVLMSHQRLLCFTGTAKTSTQTHGGTPTCGRGAPTHSTLSATSQPEIWKLSSLGRRREALVLIRLCGNLQSSGVFCFNYRLSPRHPCNLKPPIWKLGSPSTCLTKSHLWSNASECLPQMSLTVRKHQLA